MLGDTVTVKYRQSPRAQTEDQTRLKLILELAYLEKAMCEVEAGGKLLVHPALSRILSHLQKGEFVKNGISDLVRAGMRKEEVRAQLVDPFLA